MIHAERPALGCSLAVALVALSLCTPARAAEGLDAETRTRAEAAIARGLEFLKTRQAADGDWSKSVGITALAARGYLESPNDGARKFAPAVSAAIKFLLSKRNPDGSISEGKVNSGYNTSTSLTALVATRDPAYADTMRKAQAYLKGIQIDEHEGFHSKQPWYGGIGYSDDERPDMSNQFLALQALRASSLDPKDPVWEKALKFVSRSQNRSESNDEAWAGNDGGFIYMPGMNLPPFRGTESYGTMTSAGLLSLLYAGVDKSDPRVQDAYRWIRNHYTLDYVPGTTRKDGIYYYYFAYAHCMAAYGEATVVDGSGQSHRWRDELAQKLVSLQRPDGSWINQDSPLWWQDNPDLVTAFTVIALDQVLK